MVLDEPERLASKPAAPGASLTAVAALAIAAFLAAAPAAVAEDVARGQKIWHDKAECNFCHGWAGDGLGGFHHPGKAPSLRGTQLTRDQIRMMIQCGRPGTPMPYFDRFAYTDKRCYGMTADDLHDMMPNPATTPMQRDEIDALADYVATKIKGAGPVTRTQCQEYFGAATSRCDIYPER